MIIDTEKLRENIRAHYSRAGETATLRNLERLEQTEKRALQTVRDIENMAGIYGYKEEKNG